MNWYFALLPALSDWYTATGAGDHILRGIQTLRSPKCGSLWGIQCPVRLHVRFPRRSLSRGGGLGCGHHLSVARHASPQLARLWPPGAKVSCRNKLLLLANWSLISLIIDFRDLMAIVSALEYNTFFRGLKAAHMRLSHETLERILHVLKRSMWLEELHLEALGLR